jgi:DNA-binding NarL/FixJ family response regulator
MEHPRRPRPGITVQVTIRGAGAWRDPRLDRGRPRRGNEGLVDPGDATDMTVVGEAAGGGEALEMARTVEWDAMVLDLAMPDRSGFDVLLELAARGTGRPILVMSMYAEDQYARRVLKAGASGYLTKETAPDELLAAIQSRARQEVRQRTPWPDDWRWKSAAADRALRALSDRNSRSRLLGQGKTVSQIAGELFERQTVSTYRHRVLVKLNLKTNGEVIHYTLQQARRRCCPVGHGMPWPYSTACRTRAEQLDNSYAGVGRHRWLAGRFVQMVARRGLPGQQGRGPARNFARTETGTAVATCGEGITLRRSKPKWARRQAWRVIAGDCDDHSTASIGRAASRGAGSSAATQRRMELSRRML